MSALTRSPSIEEPATSPACVHSVFGLRVSETPQAIALQTGSVAWSYKDLDDSSNRIANRLVRSGVGRGCLVGLMVQRSSQAMAAILGILKAGAAYVPLDVTYPAERLRFMIGDADLKIVLTSGESSSRLEQITGGPHQFVDVGQVQDENSSAPDISVDPSDLAYVMYTSGSTGKPKGVMIEHRSIVRFVSNQNYFSFSAQERFLQVASLSFDLSTFEIWGSLLNGACLVLIPPSVPSLSDLAEILERQRISTLLLSTGLFNALVEEFPGSFRHLSNLLVAGDVLSPPHARKAMEAMRYGRLINGYGPTESTTFASCHQVRPEDITSGSIPIGIPIAATSIYILDQNLQPVSGRESGEIYIAGAGLARGYLNRPELTQEKFLKHAFSGDPSARMYRSGDMGRFNARGEIEFLGRLDSQVKIRGFRVETSEIEIAASLFPDVSAAAVVVNRRDSDDKSLCCFFVPRSGKTVSGADLEGYLREKLPPYMVPAQFVSIDRLPLNANGKVDRAALPLPSISPSCDEEVFGMDAQTEIQNELISILSGLFGGRPVRLQDNFYELGGHSLVAAQLIARVQSAFGVELSLRTVYESATVAGLSQDIEETILAQLAACPPYDPSGSGSP
jgi:amino acid adenylation domain-containing protein